MRVHTRRVAITYADVLKNNARAARSRAGLDQEDVAERMRELGFSAWLRQTVTRIERGRRRLTAEEVFGLALALGTTPVALLSPTPDDDAVELPGSSLPDLPALHVIAMIVGQGRYVAWAGNRPTYPGRPVGLGSGLR
jgi:transcriptional regulator with XRE-family HTH domain